MEAVERPAIGRLRLGRSASNTSQIVWSLQLGMAVRLGVGDAPIEQPGVQLVVALDPQPRREEALAHQADLVLDLALLPAGCRRAGDRLDQIVAAHLQEAPVVGPLLADEDRLHRRLHVVVDAARAGALEEGERPVMGVEHHLLASRADRRARTACGCGRAGRCATFTVTVVPLISTTSWLQSNW